MMSDLLKMADGLEVHETDDGLIVYQQSTDRVHHLNQTAAVILYLCDGTQTAEAIAEAVAEVFGLSDPPTAETEECIGRLEREGLIR
jgi:PqqD family protein of HPr-rel-A system